MRSLLLAALMVVGAAGQIFNSPFQFTEATVGIATGLAGYWKLDEASGARADSSVNAQTLTDNNTVGQAVGKVGSAASFQAGVSEFLSRSDSAVLSLGTSDATWDGWVFPTSADDNYNVITKGSDVDAANFEFRLFHPTDMALRWRVSNGSAYAQVSTPSGVSVPLNQWTYFRCTLNVTAGLIEIELNNDGTVYSAAIVAGGSWDSNRTFFIGNLTGSASYAGRIDEVGYWKRLLTDVEQTARYNGGNGNTLP